jgi:hypothetical protein
MYIRLLDLLSTDIEIMICIVINNQTVINLYFLYIF